MTKLKRRPVGKAGTVVSLCGDNSTTVVVEDGTPEGMDAVRDTSTGEERAEETLLLPRILCAYSAKDCTLRPDRRLLLSSRICPTAIGPAVSTLVGLDNDEDERLPADG